MRRAAVIALLLLQVCGAPAFAEGELILPIPGPILRDATADDAEHPFCAAPSAFASGNELVPPGTFDYLVDALANGAIGGAQLSNVEAVILPDAALLKSSVHLARVRRLAGGFTPKENWHVVSLRADLCRSEFHGDATSSCEDQFRLVAQPFAQAGMFIRAYDFALHLVYVLPARDDFVRARDRLDTLAANAGYAGAQDLLDAKPYSCDARFQDQVDDLIRQFARPERLSFISWVTSSASGQQWTFGRFVSDSAGRLVPSAVTASGYFDNFSKPLLLSDQCPINADASAAEKAAFRCSSVGAQASASQLLERLADPHDLRRPETLCVACHSGDTLTAISRADRINDELGLPIFKRNNVDPANFRQFGYDLHGHRSLSHRLIRVRND